VTDEQPATLLTALKVALEQYGLSGEGVQLLPWN
jgi:hypothetical protein